MSYYILITQKKKNIKTKKIHKMLVININVKYNIYMIIINGGIKNEKY